VIAVAAVIAAAVWAGVAAERRRGAAARELARRGLFVALYVLFPFIVFFNAARLHVTSDIAGGIGLAYLMLGLVGLLAYAAARALRLRRAQQGALVTAAIQANTGFVGVPLVATLLGSAALGQAVAYDAVVSAPVLFVAVFGVGAAFGDKAGEGARARTASFFLRNPPLLALIAAVLVPDALAPDVLVDASRVLVFVLVPIGFFAVGVTLSSEAEEGGFRFPPRLTAPVGTALALRLIVAPALLLALAAPLIHLPDTYLLQAAMPTGINSLVVGHAFGLDLRIISGAIAWSTAIVVIAGTVADVVQQL
jgi:predicted permease